MSKIIGIAIVIMLLCVVSSIGCVEREEIKETSHERIQRLQQELDSIPELEIEVTRVQDTGTGYTRVVYTIENIGSIPVTRLQVQVFLKDSMGKITAVETCYPSDYPNYGLNPGQILYADRLFNEQQSYGCTSGGVKIVNYNT